VYKINGPVGYAFLPSAKVIYTGQSVLTCFKSTNIEGYQWPGGLQSYDFRQGTWQNLSTETMSSHGHMENGVLHYMDAWGARGTLVAFGGRNEDGARLNDEIHVYDIDSGIWFMQRANGTAPSPRTALCSVGAASTSDTTYGELAFLLGCNSIPFYPNSKIP
jgi:hypothetical protein